MQNMVLINIIKHMLQLNLCEYKIPKIGENLGKKIQSLGFLSTSSSKEAAQGFIDNAMFIIHVKQQKKIKKYCLKTHKVFGFTSIEKNSEFYGQKQVLFNCFSQFIIKKYEKKEQIHCIQLEYVNPQQTKKEWHQYIQYFKYENKQNKQIILTQIFQYRYQQQGDYLLNNQQYTIQSIQYWKTCLSRSINHHQNQNQNQNINYFQQNSKILMSLIQSLYFNEDYQIGKGIRIQKIIKLYKHKRHRMANDFIKICIRMKDFQEKKQYKKALIACQQSIQYINKNWNRRKIFYSDQIRQKGKLLYNLQKYQESQKYLIQAYNLKYNQDRESLFLAQLLIQIGDNQLQQNKQQAEFTYLKAQKLIKDILGHQKSQLFYTSKYKLALFYSNIKKNKLKALELIEQICDIWSFDIKTNNTFVDVAQYLLIELVNYYESQYMKANCK